MKPGRPSSSRLVPTLAAAAFLSLAYLLDRAYAVDPQKVGKCLERYWQCWFWLLGLTALYALAAVLYMRYHTLSARTHRLANAPPLVLAILTICYPFVFQLIPSLGPFLRRIPPISQLHAYLFYSRPLSFLIIAALLVVLSTLFILPHSPRDKPE